MDLQGTAEEREFLVGEDEEDESGSAPAQQPQQPAGATSQVLSQAEPGRASIDSVQSEGIAGVRGRGTGPDSDGAIRL